ncbi:MAG TPA: carboxypeptidase-like regulatory domain-containing protein [Gemmatimonadales bacterium]|nr:carboxypeptidase-like regulatory domain-containing protein [Gemmatimonadales bacterium]
MRRWLLVTILWALPSYASAQSIRVRTVEVETGRAISGAIVVLLDSAGRRLVQGLTDDLGRISLTAPIPGIYRVKADRIGHPGVTSDPFNSATTATLTLEMPGERFELPEIAVSGTSVCGRSENAETAQLWEEIRKALSASQITSASQSVELSVRRFVRSRTLGGQLRKDSTTRTFTTRLSPFVTGDPSSLLQLGYIQGSGNDIRFLGPDAHVLLSDDFLDTHCFRMVQAGKEMPGSVGLGFEPVKGRKVPEIKGTLWVDRGSAELRALDYEYVNVPSAVRAPGLGGRSEFARLSTGDWIIRDWYIRVPDRVDRQRRLSARLEVRADTIVGFIDDGGSARPLGDASVLIAEAGARTSSATSVTLRDVRVTLKSNSGLAIEGALIAAAELDTTLQTNAAGQGRFTDITEQRLRLRVRAIGYAPLSAVIAFSGDRRSVDTTLIMAAVVQRLDSIVVTEKPEPVRGKMEGFERRRKEGWGRFLTMEELHDPLRPTLAHQLRRFGRIHVVPCGLGYAAASMGQPPGSQQASCSKPPAIDLVCYMSVYLNGALYYSNMTPGRPLDISSLNVLDLQGLEVYRSAAELPPEYNSTGSYCGVILLWTR